MPSPTARVRVCQPTRAALALLRVALELRRTRVPRRPKSDGGQLSSWCEIVPLRLDESGPKLSLRLHGGAIDGGRPREPPGLDHLATNLAKFNDESASFRSFHSCRCCWSRGGSGRLQKIDCRQSKRDEPSERLPMAQSDAERRDYVDRRMNDNSCRRRAGVMKNTSTSALLLAIFFVCYQVESTVHQNTNKTDHTGT